MAEITRELSRQARERESAVVRRYPRISSVPCFFCKKMIVDFYKSTDPSMKDDPAVGFHDYCREKYAPKSVRRSVLKEHYVRERKEEYFLDIEDPVMSPYRDLSAPLPTTPRLYGREMEDDEEDLPRYCRPKSEPMPRCIP